MAYPQIYQIQIVFPNITKQYSTNVYDIIQQSQILNIQIIRNTGVLTDIETKAQGKMSKKQMTLVYYHIPQDHDDEEYPNVFGIMIGKNNIRLHHIYDNFPLKGSYIFRFKVMYDNTIAWLDLPELDTKLPTFKEKIVIKATRISWETSKSNPYGHYRFVKKQSSSTNPVTPNVPSSTSIKKQPQQVPQKSPKVEVESHDLLSEKQAPVKTAPANVNMMQMGMGGGISDFDLLNAHPPAPKATNNVDLGDLI